ncbi:MAG: hypothetical protein LBU58_00875 [Clostridiales bacterium]|jgi:hypothetical protein|nr:hypothetical protein [Clostridiales bacterium]
MTKRTRNLTLYAKYGLLAVGVLFIALGLLREEQLVVLKKAVKICLECIGVG